MFNAEIKFIVNGREVASDDWANEIMLESIRRAVASKLEGIRCPEHNQYPRIEMKGVSLDKLEAQVHGCCDKVVEAATKALSK